MAHLLKGLEYSALGFNERNDILPILRVMSAAEQFTVDRLKGVRMLSPISSPFPICQLPARYLLTLSRI